MNLYKDYAQEFSSTRKIPWKGWFQILPFLNKNKPLKVLDLGCGNGRFLKFLLDEGYTVSKYIGIDSSQEMLNIAYKEIKGQLAEKNLIIEFDLIQRNLDLSDWDNSLEEEFDLIVAFGLMHHIKTFKARKSILQKSKNLLSKDGQIILSFWQFLKSERLKNLIIDPSDVGIKSSSLGENDYYLTFGKDKKAYRFCHYTTENEVAELEENLGLIKKHEFYDDGKEKNLNYYVVWNSAK